LMASDAASLNTMESLNPCCIKWKTKLTKTEGKRQALRQGLDILKGQIDRLQLENANFKKECDEERTRLNVVEEEKQREISLRISMENEIALLKSEISSTKHEVASGHADLDKEACDLRTCISEKEVEINRLKQLLDGEKMKTESERKNAAELQEFLEFEKSKADEASKMANAAAKEAEEWRTQLETLKIEAEKTNLKWEEVCRKLEAEKQNVINEKKVSDEKQVKEEELRANHLQKQLEEEKQKVEKLQKEMQEIMNSKKSVDSSKLDEIKKKLEAEKKKVAREKKHVEEEKGRVIEQRRIAEANEKKVAEEKCRADKLLMQLEEEKQKIGKYERDMQDLLSSHESVNSSELDELKKNHEEEKMKVAELQNHLEEEKAKVMEQRRIAEASENRVAEEKCRADKLLMQLEEEKQKIGEYERQVQDLLLSHEAVKSSELNELKKYLEEEKMKVAEVQSHVEEEKAKVMEQRRIAEANEKRVAEEKCRADKLLMQLEEEKQNIEYYQRKMQDLLLSHKDNALVLDELKKNLEDEKNKVSQMQRHADEEKANVVEQRRIAEANEKKVAEEKCRADKLLMQLEEEKQKFEKYQMEMQDVLLSHKAVDFSELDELKRNLEEEKKSFAQAQRHVEEVNASVMEQSRIAELNMKKCSEEKCRADKLLLQLEEEKQKVQKLERELQNVISSQKSIYSSEVAEVYRILEAEKKKVERERKRADLEMSRKEEQKKLAEVSIKDAMEEKNRAVKLFEELESSKETIDKLEKELNKVHEMLELERKEVALGKVHADIEKLKSDEQGKIVIANELRAMEKSRGDNLVHELETARQKLQDMEHELQEVKLCRGPPSFFVNDQAARINLLQEQIKFEKKRVKHAKEVGKLEKGRNRVLQQELQRLKQDFQCLLDHLGMLSDNFGARSGVTNLSKKLGQSQVHFCGDELRMSTLSSRDASCLFKPNMHVGQAGRCMESTSGMENELDPLHGGSRGDDIPSYALNSNTASFSDEQLVGSQERVAGPLAMTAGLSAENTNQQVTRLKCSNQCYRQNKGEKAGIVDEHTIRSSVDTGTGTAKKRKKVFDEFEAIKCMHLEGKRIFQDAEKKLSFLQNTLLQPMMNEKIPKKGLLLPINKSNLCGNFDGSGKKRKPIREPEVLQQAGYSNEQNLVDKVIAPRATETKENSQPLVVPERDKVNDDQDALTSFEQMINGDYMKLLDLDSAVAEECFRMAMERPLSPILPEFDLNDFGQSVETQMLTVPLSENEAAHHHAFPVHNKNQMYFVLFSDMDVCSMARIYSATRTCLSRCLFLYTNWSVQDMLKALMLEKDLRPREKACVLFSLMLLNFSVVSSCKPMNLHTQEQMESFSAHIHTVLFNFDARVLCSKICDLHDLLTLSEDLLLNRKILSNNDMTCELLESCGSSIEIMHDGEVIVLWPKMASTTLVVAGAIVLASICKTVGHFGFVSEVSLKVLQMGRTEYSLVLAIVHAFADVCGEDYIANSNYSLVMKVVKSVVTFMEGSLAKNANKDFQSGDDSTQHQFTRCVRCTFSEGSVSIDEVSSEILAQLQRHTVSQIPEVLAHISNWEALSCFVGDALSCLELITSIMCWDWVCDKFVPKLFKMFESSHQDSRVFSTALVVLLGFIGRLGVEAHGYYDPGVEGIKHRLLGLLRQIDVSKCDTTLSMAIVYELIGLYPKGHEMFQKGNYVELQSEDSHSPSSSSNIVSKFLSSLSTEQKTSLAGLMKPDSEVHALIARG
ncbi:Keratin type II cytoskeletal 7, partial [Bienertia sinuspersici]